MKTLLILTLALASSIASADVINCVFTEPFVSLSYNTATETLIEREEVMNKKRVVKNVKFQIKYAGTFLLVDSKTKKVQVELRLNNQGSDGMSEAIYPYDATNNNVMGSGLSVMGGCTSELKPMVKLAH